MQNLLTTVDATAVILHTGPWHAHRAPLVMMYMYATICSRKTVARNCTLQPAHTKHNECKRGTHVSAMTKIAETLACAI